MSEPLITSLLGNPSLPGHLVFRPLISYGDVVEVVACFKQMREERIKSLKAAYRFHFDDQLIGLIAGLSTALDCERHLTKAILQEIEKSKKSLALRRDELVDLWAKIEAARALLKASLEEFVESNRSSTLTSQRKWDSLLSSEQGCAEKLIGFTTVGYGIEWAEPLSSFLLNGRVNRGASTASVT